MSARRNFLTAVLALLMSCACVAAEPGPQGGSGPIPYKADKQVEESAPRAIAGSLALLVVAGAVLYVFRRRIRDLSGKNPATRSVKVIESAALGSAARLWVVEFDGERLLLAQSGNQVTLLAGRATPPDNLKNE